MSNWRIEWRYSALYDDLGDKIDEWVAKAAPYGDNWEPVIKAIEKVLEHVESAAIAAERSECAKIADHTSAWCRSFSSEETAEHIAAAIRSRGQA